MPGGPRLDKQAVSFEWKRISGTVIWFQWHNSNGPVSFAHSEDPRLRSTFDGHKQIVCHFLWRYISHSYQFLLSLSSTNWCSAAFRRLLTGSYSLSFYNTFVHLCKNRWNIKVSWCNVVVLGFKGVQINIRFVPQSSTSELWLRNKNMMI